MSDESIKPPTTSNNSFSPALTYTGKKMRVKFDGSYAGFDKYKYSDYGIGFDLHGSFSLVNGNEFGKNAIIFGADMSSVDMSYFARAILKMYFLRKQF